MAEDKAFVWITFSDDLAMQSRDKFRELFENTLENYLLTTQDINRGKLNENDHLVLELAEGRLGRCKRTAPCAALKTKRCAKRVASISRT